MKAYLKEIRIHKDKEHVANDGSTSEIVRTTSEDKRCVNKVNKAVRAISDLMRPHTDKEGKEHYCEKHGHHFNKALSEYAVSLLNYVDPSAKVIKYDKCADLMKGNGIKLPENATHGDLHYVINKIRAEHTLDTVKTDIHALKLAIECLENPNTEEGEIFLQWVKHQHLLNKEIHWSEYTEE